MAVLDRFYCIQFRAKGKKTIIYLNNPRNRKTKNPKVKVIVLSRFLLENDEIFKDLIQTIGFTSLLFFLEILKKKKKKKALKKKIATNFSGDITVILR